MTTLIVGVLAWPAQHADGGRLSGGPRFLDTGTPVEVLRVGDGWCLVRVAGGVFKVPAGFLKREGSEQ